MEEKLEIAVITNDQKLCVANFDELKTKLTNDMSDYKEIVVNSDNKAETKKTIASLRKQRKDIEDKRISLKEDYNKPFAFFESQVKELVAIIDEPIASLDSKVKKIETALDSDEQNQKAKRYEAIKLIFNGLGVSWIKFEEVYNEKMEKLKLEEVKEQLEEIIEAKKTVVESLDADSATIYLMCGFDYEKAASMFSDFAKAKKRYKTFQDENDSPF